MKKFAVILKYELKEYISGKGFVAFTLLLAIIGAVLLCLPRFIDMSAFTGVDSSESSNEEETVPDTPAAYNSDKKYALYDPGNIADIKLLSDYFFGAQFVKVSDTGELEKMLEDETADAGFAVKSQTEYEYYVFNKTMYDSDSEVFNEAMKAMSRARYCEQHGLDLSEITQMYDPPITVTEHILNKNTTQSYWYCYALVIIVFMLIMFYGQMIAVSVTTEKSNRAIEVLVTSTTPNSLLFGKVIAGAIAGLLQSGIILGTILVSYRFNRQLWGGMLDIVLDIPANVLIVFAVFGTLGYLFYAFLFGAMGALVSKTEDVSKSVSGLTMIIMLIYFFSLFQLSNVDGIIIKVLSYLPFSSYTTMFMRIAMGSVAVWEIIVSLIILIASVIGAGMLGAALYRMGTLRYGNPIKLSAALKGLKKQ